MIVDSYVTIRRFRLRPAKEVEWVKKTIAPPVGDIISKRVMQSPKGAMGEASATAETVGRAGTATSEAAGRAWTGAKRSAIKLVTPGTQAHIDRTFGGNTVEKVRRHIPIPGIGILPKQSERIANAKTGSGVLEYLAGGPLVGKTPKLYQAAKNLITKPFKGAGQAVKPSISNTMKQSGIKAARSSTERAAAGLSRRASLNKLSEKIGVKPLGSTVGKTPGKGPGTALVAIPKKARPFQGPAPKPGPAKKVPVGAEHFAGDKAQLTGRTVRPQLMAHKPTHTPWKVHDAKTRTVKRTIANPTVKKIRNWASAKVSTKVSAVKTKAKEYGAKIADTSFGDFTEVGRAKAAVNKMGKQMRSRQVDVFGAKMSNRVLNQTFDPATGQLSMEGAKASGKTGGSKLWSATQKVGRATNKVGGAINQHVKKHPVRKWLTVAAGASAAGESVDRNYPGAFPYAINRVKDRVESISDAIGRTSVTGPGFLNEQLNRVKAARRAEQVRRATEKENAFKTDSGPGEGLLARAKQDKVMPQWGSKGRPAAKPSTKRRRGRANSARRRDPVPKKNVGGASKDVQGSIKELYELQQGRK